MKPLWPRGAHSAARSASVASLNEITRVCEERPSDPHDLFLILEPYRVTVKVYRMEK